MSQTVRPQCEFEAEVRGRLGLLPNFFRCASDAAILVQQLWLFAQAAYLDNPLPPLFKERLLAHLARYAGTRYWRVRHAGFLLGQGFPAGDAAAQPQSPQQVIDLFQVPLPSQERIQSAIGALLARPLPFTELPGPGHEDELALFHAAGAILLDPEASELPRRAVRHALGEQNSEWLLGLVAFARASHMWVAVHPEISVEEEMEELLRQQPELAALLNDPGPDARVEVQRLEYGPADAPQERREQDTLLMTVGHDLRNPLAAISAVSEVFQLTGLTDPGLRKANDILRRQTQAMRRMLDDLLDAARLMRGEISIVKELLPIDHILADAVRDREAQMQEAGITVKLNLPVTHTYVLGDRNRLGQIFGNLLSNAWQSMKVPGQLIVDMNTTADRVTVRLTDAGSGLDGASGYPPAQPLQGRGNPSPGLNLVVAGMLADLHGATLEAGSPGKGKGATFTFSMPLNLQAVRSEEKRETAGPPASALRILVIEDNRDLAKLFCDLLEVMGCVTEVALNAKSAQERVTNRMPDIVFCDLGLPGEKNGFDFGRDLRSDPKTSHIPLIAVTGHGGEEIRQRALAAGFDRVFAKPVKFAEIQEVLHAFQMRSSRLH